MKKLMLPAVLLALLLVISACRASKPAASPSQSETGSPSEAAAASPAAASPAETQEFVFTRDNFPRMDGSTSTIPLGQAVACVLLGEPRADVADLAKFNKTSQSFRNLMNGEADILIVAEPNKEVFDEMKENGFTYEMTPIATDALVFMVNSSNPVEGLTTEQIQKIYTGRLTSWKDVGGSDKKIEAFQRNSESGSQALMLKLVMKDLKMMEPPQGYAIGEMEGLISAVKSFDGSANALGYTVYYYADDMKMADGLKILSVDGVAPSDETIASKAYPFLNPYYAVISAREPEDSPARVLYNWLQSPEGQNLVKTEGYVPVNG
jgi:phosphate transport system substrate-binding protein